MSLFRWVAVPVAVPVAAALGAYAWWGLWMHRGWPALPHFLQGLWPGPVDGASSYDLTQVEMFAILLVVFGIAAIFLVRRPSHAAARAAGKHRRLS